MTTDFRRDGYSKNRLICDCAGEPTHAITTLLPNSILHYKGINFKLPSVGLVGVVHFLAKRETSLSNLSVLLSLGFKHILLGICSKRMFRPFFSISVDNLTDFGKTHEE